MLTEKEALDQAVELWEGIAKTGGDKPRWARVKWLCGCPLCEYVRQSQQTSFSLECQRYCPLEPTRCYGCEKENRFAYGKWKSNYEIEYARQFRDQLIAIRNRKYPVWESITEVYKILRKTEDGWLLSSFVSPTGGPSGGPTWPIASDGATELGYEVGEVTVAPVGSMGIFCYKTFESCFDKLNKPLNVAWNCGEPVVHEAIAYGELVNAEQFTFRSIRLGRQVWPEPEEWEDVTADCFVKLDKRGSDYLPLVMHGNTIVGHLIRLDKEKTPWLADHRYEMQTEGYCLKVLRKVQ